MNSNGSNSRTIINSSNNNFDLNINNYKKSELEDIFELSPNNYTSITIESKESKLRKNIFSDNSINDTTRSKTIAFLQEAKKILISGITLGTSEIKNAFSQFTSETFNDDLPLKRSAIISENGSAFIIDKPSTTYSQSYPSEFYPGTINPLKKRVLHQHLNIDTRFRENYYSSQSTNFHFDLPIKFSNVMSMQLNAFEFPNTCYVISKQLGNNFFTIILNNGVGGIAGDSTIITIPDGNYTPNSIIVYLNNYITNTISPLFGTQFSNLIFAINNDGIASGSGQMIVGILSGTIPNFTTFSLNFQADKFGNPDHSVPLPLKLGWMFGFREGIYINNSTYVSEGLIDLSGSRYIYLVIDDYNNNVNNSFYSAFNSSILNKNILARISIQGNALGNIGISNFNALSQNNLNVISNIRQYFGPVDIQKMNIQLIDEYGRIIDLNNMDYSFCIIFQSIYDL